VSTRVEIVVLMGGPDAERPVSLLSGAQVAEALRAVSRFGVSERVIERPGRDELADMIGGRDVVFPVLHGRWGEGGALQALLEAIGVPYVGSGPRAATLAMDKVATKAIVAEHGVQTPVAQVLRVADPCTIEPPLVLKPIDDGSSVDLVVCRTRADLERARRELHGRRERLLAERYVAGRELTVGIVGGEPLPIIEIVPAEGLYDYQAKYERDDTRYVIDPGLPRGAAECTHADALIAYERLGCRDVARVDFILEGGRPWFLEVNTMPGFTTHSLVPMAARAAGLEMPTLCARLVDMALARGAVAAR
jgi:D-alanine-D-alanine ligase